MKKRLISLIVAVVMLFSMLCPAAYADDETVSFDTCTHEWETPLRSGYSITIPGSDVSFSVKTEQCKKCKWYKHVATIIIAEFTYYSPLNVDANGLVPTELATYWANVWYNNFGQNATATKAPSGIGRKDLPGYASDDGTPSVSSDGGIIWQPTWDDVFQKAVKLDVGDKAFWLDGFFTSDISHYYPDFDLTYKKGVSDAIITLSPSYKADFNWDIPISKLSFDSFHFTVPIKGKYFRLESPALYNSALDEMVYYSSSNPSSFCDSGVSLSAYVSESSANCIYVRNCYWHVWLPKYKIIPYNSADKPTSQTNITINNNTWNGNIYTDNSTNLTYIYPQYTTINENNETVTNISNNPIIYNNETKQYYTYDSVTNNYYYITYEQQPATPTPSPSPSPSPAPTETPTPSESPAPTPTPDPGENPSPTPAPTEKPDDGGDGGNKINNFWNIIFPNGGNDSEGEHKGIFWALVSLILALIAFFTNLFAGVSYLFPFLPDGVVTTINTCLFVVFLFVIIKFIMRSK